MSNVNVNNCIFLIIPTTYHTYNFPCCIISMVHVFHASYNNDKQGGEGVGCSTDMMVTKMQQNRRKLLMPKCKLDDKLDSTIDWEKAIWYKCTSYLSQTLSMHIICWGPGLDCVKLNSLHKLYQNRESLMVCMGVIRTDGRLQDGYKPFQLIWITNGTRPGQDQGLVL